MFQLAISLDENRIQSVDQNIRDGVIRQQGLQRPQTERLVHHLFDQSLALGRVQHVATLTAQFFRRAANFQPEIVLFHIEPIVEVGRPGDVEAGAQITAIQRQDRWPIVDATVEDSVGACSERRDIGGGIQLDRVAINSQRDRQSPAQVTQVPAHISAWVGSVREEQVREGFSVLPRLHECEPNEERKGLGAEIERREPRFISDRCWAQKTEPQRMTGRPCTRACAPVPVH